jgi:tetratricopeptide (TPR) repeat protein
MMREAGDRQGMAHNLFLLGRLARQYGTNAEAHAYWMECQALDEALGVKGGNVLSALGDLAQESGDYAAARRLFERFVTERYEIGDRGSVSWGLRHLGALALAEGQPERAARLFGASLALFESSDLPLSPKEREPYDRLQDTLRQTLDAHTLAAAWEAGRAMTCAQAVEHALKENQA